MGHQERRRSDSSPLARRAGRSALATSSLLLAVALAAGTIRLLPWLLDPSVPWRVAAPFARGLAAMAAESALLVGLPVGWALATFRSVELGEVRVVALLGEAPWRTAGRILPQAAAFAPALLLLGALSGRDAAEPGRIATELIANARESCGRAVTPRSYAVPFTGLSFACAPGRPPRLVGRGPSGLSAVFFSASGAAIAGDFRSLELDNPEVLFGPATVRSGHLIIRGLAPWAQSTSLPPWGRAFVMAVSGLAAGVSALLAGFSGLLRGRIGAIIVGTSGPLAALGMVRLLERSYAPAWAYACVPLAVILSAAAAALGNGHLPRVWGAATKFLKRVGAV